MRNVIAVNAARSRGRFPLTRREGESTGLWGLGAFGTLLVIFFGYKMLTPKPKRKYRRRRPTWRNRMNYRRARRRLRRR